MGIWYCTREDVKSALDIKETARSNAQVDRAIESASRSVEGLTRRRFYPETATRYFDWPNTQFARPWRLWLDENELVSVTTLQSGATSIASTDYFLEPANSGPPFRSIELDLDSDAAFGQGDTHQRDITVTGVFGYSAETTSAGTLTEALSTTTQTQVNVSGSAATALGVGDLILIESERLMVTDRTFGVNSGQTIQANLTASKADETVSLASTTGFVTGEQVLVDAERMLIVDISGNDLIVKRAWDGSTLAAHSSGAAVFVNRRLTVTRGAVGTTAATHSSGTAIAKHVVPGLVRNLCVAEAIVQLQQEQAAYGRTVGSGDNEREAAGRGLAMLRKDVKARYGRKARVGVI